MTGRRYQIAWEALDPRSLREVQRLLRDLQYEQLVIKNRARMHPWRG